MKEDNKDELQVTSNKLQVATNEENIFVSILGEIISTILEKDKRLE